LGLEQAVLGVIREDEVKNNQKKMTKKELEDLLKKGAYGALMDENDEDAEKFDAADIDSILKERTKTIVQEDDGKYNLMLYNYILTIRSIPKSVINLISYIPILSVHTFICIVFICTQSSYQSNLPIMRCIIIIFSLLYICIYLLYVYIYVKPII